MLAKVTFVSDGGGVGTRSPAPESVPSVPAQCSQVISRSPVSVVKATLKMKNCYYF